MRFLVLVPFDAAFGGADVAAENHRPLVRLDNDDLVSFGMAGRRHEPHSRQDLRLASVLDTPIEELDLFTASDSDRAAFIKANDPNAFAQVGAPRYMRSARPLKFCVIQPSKAPSPLSSTTAP